MHGGGGDHNASYAWEQEVKMIAVYGSRRS